MVDIIEVVIITITDVDIDPDTIITMDIDIPMVVVTEHSQVAMDIIRTKVNIITDINIIRRIIDTIKIPSTTRIPSIIKITDTTIITRTIETIGTIAIIIEVITTEAIRTEVLTTELPDHVQQVDSIDKSLGSSNLFEPLANHYLAIISKIFPTINPPKVPTMYPIIAISTPMGISALE